MTEFKLKIEPAGVEIPCSADTSLLDAALAAGYSPRHSCRRGQCNACETRVVSGEVRYLNDFKPEGVRDGHILTCRAQPVTDVTIDAPEVLGTPGRRIVQVGARVTGIERVSADVARVVLSVPPTSGFSFEAGQYVEVILRDGSRRSYSMANESSEEGAVEWHIRAVPGGRFSNYVYSTLKLRDMLRIEGPFGTFSLRDSSAPIIFLSSGTGYAPIAAMFKSHRAAIQRRGAVLYWGGARLADLYAYDEARGWEQDHHGIRFIPVLSSNEPDWTGRTGFVHEAVAMDFPDLSKHEVYACGNPLMVDAARQTFTRRHGLPVTSFFSDSFVSYANTGEQGQLPELRQKTYSAGS